MLVAVYKDEFTSWKTLMLIYIPGYFYNFYFLQSTWHVMFSHMLIHTKFHTILLKDVYQNNLEKLLKKLLPVLPEKVARRKRRRKTEMTIESFFRCTQTQLKTFFAIISQKF